MELENDIIVDCPHCKEKIIIEKLNCRIFRHAIYKKNGRQIDPHSSKDICDKLLNKNLIYGCGKPFKIIYNNSNFEAISCDYI